MSVSALAPFWQKRCARCRRELPVDCFARNQRTTDGLGSWCRECHREYSRAYAETHRDKRREDWRRYYHAKKARAAAAIRVVSG